MISRSFFSSDTVRFIAVAILLNLTVATAQMADFAKLTAGMLELDIDRVPDLSQAPTKIQSPVGCGYPLTLVATSEETVRIFASPPNLVRAKEVKHRDYSVLALEYTTKWTAGSGNSTANAIEGVVIGVHAEMLRAVEVRGQAQMQILGGFTALEEIKTRDSGRLMADLLSNEANCTLKTLDCSITTIVGDLEGSSSRDSSKLYVSGNLQHPTLTMDAELVVDGNVIDPSFLGRGSAYVYGNIQGGNVSADANLTVAGSVDEMQFHGPTTIQAGSCGVLYTKGNDEPLTEVEEYCTEASSIVNPDPVVFIEMPVVGSPNECHRFSGNQKWTAIIVCVVIAAVIAGGFAVWDYRKRQAGEPDDSSKSKDAVLQEGFPGGNAEDRP